MASREDLADEILTVLARRHSTATVLFHHALADRLGLGPTDHKCLDLLSDRGPMTGSELAAATGLTTGAVTGVVSRLEQHGLLAREPHPRDRRKQVLRPTDTASRRFQEVFASLRTDAGELLDGFDATELAAIHRFLNRTIDFAYRRAAALRAQKGLPAPTEPEETTP